jgi:hypothetical protein
MKNMRQKIVSAVVVAMAAIGVSFGTTGFTGPEAYASTRVVPQDVGDQAIKFVKLIHQSGIVTKLTDNQLAELFVKMWYLGQSACHGEVYLPDQAPKCASQMIDLIKSDANGIDFSKATDIFNIWWVLYSEGVQST